MSKNDDYATRNQLDFSYYQNYYKLIGIDLSRQTDTSIPPQTNFTEKLEEDDGATIFFVSEEQLKAILNLPLDSLFLAELYNNATSNEPSDSKFLKSKKFKI